MKRERTNYQGIAAIILGLSIAPGITQANESDAVGPGDSDSKWVLGGYTGGFTNPYAEEDDFGFIIPNVEYRGERIFFKDGVLGANLFRHADSGISVGALLTYSGSILLEQEDYEDNEVLAGLEERDSTLNAGLYMLHTTPLGRLKLTVQDEVTNEHNGQYADLSYTFDLSFDKWHINPKVGLSWSGADSVNHFFGVSESEANEFRQAYEGKSTTNFYTSIRGRYQFNKNWDLNLGLAYVNLGSGIADSSIVDDDDMFGAVIGTNYNF